MTAKLIGALMMAAFTATGVSAGQVVRESARGIPAAYEVDVVVVGGTTQAVEAAAAAAGAGAKVFLAAPRNYLGDDVCGSLRLWHENGQEPATKLGRRLFDVPAKTRAATEKPAVRLTTPMQVKTALDEALRN